MHKGHSDRAAHADEGSGMTEGHVFGRPFEEVGKAYIKMGEQASETAEAIRSWFKLYQQIKEEVRRNDH